MISETIKINVGLLDPPPGLHVQKLNLTTLYLSWNAPDTLRGIPISNYSVDIDNLVTLSTVTVFTSVNQPSIDPNTTSLDLSRVGSIGYLYDPGCESLQFTVRAWNSVGEGASSVVLYTQGKIGICLFNAWRKMFLNRGAVNKIACKARKNFFWITQYTFKPCPLLC